MRTRPAAPFCVFVLGVAAALALSPPRAAASPSMPVQIVPAGAFHPDTDSLGQAPAPLPAHVATAYQPAPMPDPDYDPPHGGAAAGGPSLTPALFSQKAEFSGNGYADSSDPDHGLDHRRTPAAGLNWSVPVK